MTEIETLLYKLANASLEGVLAHEEAREALRLLGDAKAIGYDEIADCLSMYPELTEAEAARFIYTAKTARLNWRMQDIYPILSTDDVTGERVMRPLESQKAIVDSFDQWCRLFDAAWAVRDSWIVATPERRFDFDLQENDLMIEVHLSDTVLRSQYLRHYAIFCAACAQIGYGQAEAERRWYQQAGDMPQQTMTTGYGIWRGDRETVKPQYNRNKQWYATKRGLRDAIMQRAPHVVSIRRTIPVEQEYVEVLAEIKDLTPEQIAERWVTNAKKLGRYYSESDLV